MNSTQNKKGFTIIEVVLVLAIAGLIFLMVFIALPALQRGQRDNQRKDDVARINTQLQNYQSANRGKIPSSATGTGAGTIGSFKNRYMAVADEYTDPQGAPYTFFLSATNADPTAIGQIAYSTNVICGDDGAVTATGATARSYALRIKLENQTALYCIDNR